MAKQGHRFGVWLALGFLVVLLAIVADKAGWIALPNWDWHSIRTALLPWGRQPAARPTAAEPEPDTLATLIGYLDQEDSAAANYAAAQLAQWEIRGSSDLDDLVDALDHSRPVVRYCAACALRRLGERAEPVAPRLVRHLTGEDPFLRWIVIEVLYNLHLKSLSETAAFLREEAQRFRPGRAHVDIAAEWWRVERSAAAVELLTDSILVALVSEGGARPFVTRAVRDMGPEIVPVLRELLAGRDSRRRYAAARVLALLGPDGRAAEAELLDYAAERVPDAVVDVAETLGKIGAESDRAAHLLTEFLEDDSGLLRAGAAFSLCRLRHSPPEVFPILRGCLRGDPAAWRQRAALALGRLGPAAEPALADLIEALAQDGDDDVRIAAATACVAIGPPAAPALARLLSHAAAMVRNTAAGSVEQRGAAGAAAVPDLIAALRDEEADVRWRSAEALGKIRVGTATAIGPLAELVHDPHGNTVRYCAAIALGEVEGDATEKLGPLTAFLGDEEPLVVGVALRALGSLGPAARPALPEVRRLLQKGEQSDAPLALAAIDPNGAVDDLAAALSPGSPSTRTNSALALGRFGPAANSAVPDLKRALRDHDRSVRIYAAMALFQIGGNAETALATISAILRTPSWDSGNCHLVNAIAMRALREMGPASRPMADQLQRLLDSEDLQLRVEAARALWALEGQPDAVVPALIGVLRRNHSRSLQSAAGLIEEIGAAAAPALPWLVSLMESDDELVRLAAHRAANILRAAIEHEELSP